MIGVGRRGCIALPSMIGVGRRGCIALPSMIGVLRRGWIALAWMIGVGRRGCTALSISVGDLAARDLFERDGQVVLRDGVDHRRRELLEGPLAEVVVVAVDLPRALGGDDDARVRRVDVFE